MYRFNSWSRVARDSRFRVLYARDLGFRVEGFGFRVSGFRV